MLPVLFYLRVLFVHSLVGYIGEYEVVDDHRSGKIVVELVGRINKCGVISPRFDIALNEIDQWASDLLPSRLFGYLVCQRPSQTLLWQPLNRMYLL